MKTKKLFGVLIIVSLVVIQSCGFSVKSESSCKKKLCEGWWCDDHGGQPFPESHGSFIFNSDGSCKYGQIEGTWQLGDAMEVSSTMSARKINVSMSKDIGEGVGKEFVMHLSNDGSYIMFEGSMTMYYHFDDKSQRLN